MMCWRDIVRNRYGDAIVDWYRVGAPQPAHEPYRLPRSNGIAVAERVFPVLSKAWHVMLARRHCRRSQQEIKSWLWQVGHCLTS
jgi:hypothetical protein